MRLALLKLAGGLTLLFGLAIGLVRFRPYDDPDLRRFLLPPAGCPSPCFLGVRPGSTAVDDAVTILSADTWIDRVVQSANFYDVDWSGRQPAFIDDSAFNYFMADSNRVGELRLRTHVPLGDVVVTLGQPDGVYTRPAQSGVFYIVIYARLGLEIGGYVPCHTRPPAIWKMPVEIRVQQVAFDPMVTDSETWHWIDCT